MAMAMLLSGHDRGCVTNGGYTEDGEEAMPCTRRLRVDGNDRLLRTGGEIIHWRDM